MNTKIFPNLCSLFWRNIESDAKGNPVQQTLRQALQISDKGSVEWLLVTYIYVHAKGDVPYESIKCKLHLRDILCFDTLLESVSNILQLKRRRVSRLISSAGEEVTNALDLVPGQVYECILLNESLSSHRSLSSKLSTLTNVSHESEIERTQLDYMRIFVFRPYIPVYLKREALKSYTNLLRAVSWFYGFEIQSIHHLNGIEVESSRDILPDNIYIAVEKKRANEPCEYDNKMNEGIGKAQTSEKQSSSTKPSDAPVDKKIQVRSLYSYQGDLQPWPCSLQKDDLLNMTHLLSILAATLHPPGHYFLKLFDKEGNEIQDPSQISSDEEYLALPQIVSHIGWNYLHNESDQTGWKWKNSTSYSNISLEGNVSKEPSISHVPTALDTGIGTSSYHEFEPTHWNPEVTSLSDALINLGHFPGKSMHNMSETETLGGSALDIAGTDNIPVEVSKPQYPESYYSHVTSLHDVPAMTETAEPLDDSVHHFTDDKPLQVYEPRETYYSHVKSLHDVPTLVETAKPFDDSVHHIIDDKPFQISKPREPYYSHMTSQHDVPALVKTAEPLDNSVHPITDDNPLQVSKPREPYYSHVTSLHDVPVLVETAEPLDNSVHPITDEKPLQISKPREPYYSHMTSLHDVPALVETAEPLDDSVYHIIDDNPLQVSKPREPYYSHATSRHDVPALVETEPLDDSVHYINNIPVDPIFSKPRYPDANYSNVTSLHDVPALAETAQPIDGSVNHINDMDPIFSKPMIQEPYCSHVTSLHDDDVLSSVIESEPSNGSVHHTIFGKSSKDVRDPRADTPRNRQDINSSYEEDTGDLSDVYTKYWDAQETSSSNKSLSSKSSVRIWSNENTVMGKCPHDIEHLTDMHELLPTAMLSALNDFAVVVCNFPQITNYTAIIYDVYAIPTGHSNSQIARNLSRPSSFQGTIPDKQNSIPKFHSSPNISMHGPEMPSPTIADESIHMSFESNNQIPERASRTPTPSNSMASMENLYGISNRSQMSSLHLKSYHSGSTPPVPVNSLASNFDTLNKSNYYPLEEKDAIGSPEILGSNLTSKVPSERKVTDSKDEQQNEKGRKPEEDSQNMSPFPNQSGTTNDVSDNIQIFLSLDGDDRALELTFGKSNSISWRDLMDDFAHLLGSHDPIQFLINSDGQTVSSLDQLVNGSYTAVPQPQVPNSACKFKSVASEESKLTPIAEEIVINEVLLAETSVLSENPTIAKEPPAESRDLLEEPTKDKEQSDETSKLPETVDQNEATSSHPYRSSASLTNSQHEAILNAIKDIKIPSISSPYGEVIHKNESELDLTEQKPCSPSANDEIPKIVVIKPTAEATASGTSDQNAGKSFPMQHGTYDPNMQVPEPSPPTISVDPSSKKNDKSSPETSTDIPNRMDDKTPTNEEYFAEEQNVIYIHQGNCPAPTLVTMCSLLIMILEIAIGMVNQILMTETQNTNQNEHPEFP